MPLGISTKKNLSRSYDLEEKREKRREKSDGRDTRTDLYNNPSVTS